MSRVVHKLGVFVRVVWKRLGWILLLGGGLALVGFAIDQWNYDRADAKVFVDYYDFTVNNSREGESVFFKVCRRHDQNYNYTGSLSVYVVPNTNDLKQNIQRYTQQLGGTLRPGDCENKVITPERFVHKVGNYTMSFCITFKVKYGFEKRACKDSNIYTILPRPDDIQTQIRQLQEQIDALKKQLTEPAAVNEPSDLYAGPSTAQPATPSQPQASGGTADPSQQQAPPPSVQPPAQQQPGLVEGAVRSLQNLLRN